MQVCKGCVECCVDSILCRPVHTVSKLVLIQVSNLAVKARKEVVEGVCQCAVCGVIGCVAVPVAS